MATIKVSCGQITPGELRAHYAAQATRVSAALSDDELMAAFRVITSRDDLTRDDVADLYDKIKGERA
jgi:hypothetical protein